MQIVLVVAAGSAGTVVGAVVAAYALTVSAEGRLPRLSLSRLVQVRPRRAVLLGAVMACAVSVVMIAVLGWSDQFWVLWPPGLLGVGVAIVDVRRRRLPFVMTGAMIAISGSGLLAVAVISGNPAPLMRALVAAVAAVGAFLAVALALPGQLGLGDVILIGWIALTLGWLSWERLGVGLLAGLVLQAGAAAMLMATRRRRVAGGLPMGPALVAGWLVAVTGLGAG